MQTKHFDCSCSSFHHTIRFLWFQDDWMKERKIDKDLYMDIHLNIHHPWYKRIWIAIRYIFKMEACGSHDDVYFTFEDVKKLQEFINQFDTGESNEEVS